MPDRLDLFGVPDVVPADWPLEPESRLVCPHPASNDTLFSAPGGLNMETQYT